MIVDGVKKGVEVLSAFARAILDPQTQKLVEAGFLGKDLEVTEKGVNAINIIVATEWKEKLVDAAEAEIASLKKKDK